MSNQDLKNYFLDSIPFIDVRAPIEFKQGHLPGAVNFPILNDQERELIGTIYKKQGREQAVKTGFELISGQVKDNRVRQWADFIKANPHAVIYCFRGGQRSQITQKWLSDIGVQVPIIRGGFKVARNFLIEEFQRLSKELKFILISGPTGSGKTDLLHLLQSNKTSIIDLENLANHRGSAFGGSTDLQPSQVLFENKVAIELLKIENSFNENPKIVFVEDESRMIGRCALPRYFFESIRASQVIWVDEKIETRVDNIFKDYILNTPIGRNEAGAEDLFQKYIESIRAISRRLGGLRAQELILDIQNSSADFKKGELESNKIWILKLLNWYYDPMYLGSLERRQVSILFKGNKTECYHYILKLS